MIARVYVLLCLFAGGAGAGLYLTDSFNTIVLMIFGFFVSILAGAALLVVFPAMLSERVSSISSTANDAA